MWLICSEDAGQTWSAPRQIAPVDYYVSSPVRELSDGRLALGIYHQGGGSAHGAFTYGDDGGETWAQPIDVDNAGGKPLSEPDVMERDNRSLYLIQRYNGPESMYYAVSADRGNSWSPSRPLGFAGQAPYLHRAPDGTWILATRGKDVANWGTHMRISRDEGRTWSKVVKVDSWANGAYPSMVNLRDGSILVVYYDDKGFGRPGGYRSVSNVRARRFRVTPEGITWLAPRIPPAD